MEKIKVAVIYYSTYGTNYEIARVAAEAAKETGADVRVRKVRETAPREVVEGQEGWVAQEKRTADIPVASEDDMRWAEAYFFSTPTRFGVPASQMRAFIDTLGPLWQKGELANKAVTAVTSALNPHGGQETTLLSMYTTFMHWGSILVPPGYTDESIFAAGGNPYGASITATGEGLRDEERRAISHQARRLIEVAAKLRSDVELRRAA